MTRGRRFIKRGLNALMPAAWLCLGGGAGAAESESAAAQYIQLIKANCHTCHHPESDNDDIPPLHALSAGEIAALLFAYKNDEKTATIMNRIAKSLADEDIPPLSEALAADGIEAGP